MAMQISRRNFVAGAATVGAMAAFSMAGCSSKGSGKAESKAEEYDIVIVGAGGAGMSAAIAAHDAGVEKVVVLEKEGNVGGNTNFSSSGMNASETKFQKAQGIDMSTRDKVSAAELEQPGKFAWEVFDQTVYDKNKAAANYDKSGLVKKGDSVEALAKEIEVDAATLQATIDAYNKLTTEGATDEFGRTQGMIEFQPGNMYAIKVAPGIHHEMGGIKINVDNQALGEGDEPIKGLYAAGEVTGGIHGNNRIGGNAVCDITVFGKNAGEVVAKAIQG